MKLSPWWDAVTQPPVHVGWYETKVCSDFYCSDGDDRIVRLWWTGRSWRKGPGIRPPARFGWRGDSWRGVLREAEE